MNIKYIQCIHIILNLPFLHEERGRRLSESDAFSTTGSCPEHSGKGQSLGGACRGQHMLYKFCCGSIFLSPEHRHLCPPTLNCHCLFNETSSSASSTQLALLFYPFLELSVFFLFCFLHFCILCVFEINMSVCEFFCTLSCCILSWTHSDITLGRWQEGSRKCLEFVACLTAA